MAESKLAVTNIHEAKTHFSRLVARAASGKEIVIGKAGEPLAKLVPYRPARRKRQLGLLRGQIVIREDFDELPDDVLAAFEGEET